MPILFKRSGWTDKIVDNKTVSQSSPMVDVFAHIRLLIVESLHPFYPADLYNTFFLDWTRPRSKATSPRRPRESVGSEVACLFVLFYSVTIVFSATA